MATEQRTIDPQRMQLQEYVRHDWVVTCEEGTTPQDLVDPNYWALVAVKFSPYDRIEARLETGEWIAELIVRQCERTFAKVAVLHLHEFADTDTSGGSVPDKYKVEWKGPHRRHVVIRISDGAAIKEQFASKQEAVEWLSSYEKTTAVT